MPDYYTTRLAKQRVEDAAALLDKACVMLAHGTDAGPNYPALDRIRTILDPVLDAWDDGEAERISP